MATKRNPARLSGTSATVLPFGRVRVDPSDHSDHKRIPERILHAPGSVAHGYFEAYDAFAQYTRAVPFAEKGKRTPVSARFTKGASERGLKDMARDARGFAVKFRTDEGNWDLVGNNMPVFFIQDAMKFPDLVYDLKPAPHHGISRAESPHDTFWDFVSLMPESTHMLMWVMSDRAIPRSYRMMQGFGVHTFRLINEQGESVFCKFHWKPLQGTHSLVWDEAVKIADADPDFHRRDLWEAIESGEFPEWELGLQIFTEEQAQGFSFDVLDLTKIVPEELVPITPVGRMVLNRNPDHFFAETEQVAFCKSHMVPGIDFCHHPLLTGRRHSYADTQIARIAGKAGVEPFPDTNDQDRVCGKSEKFAEHYAQAALFYNSQSAVEKAHIAAAFRLELRGVGVPAIRERMLSSLVNVSRELAADVASGLGMQVPDAMPKAITDPEPAEVTVSPALSLKALPGQRGVRTRQIAVLVEQGVHHAPLASIHRALTDAGAVVHFVGSRVGVFVASSGEEIEADRSMESSPGVLFDALVVPDGSDAVQALAGNGHAMAFIKDIFRHCKTILALGAGRELLKMAGMGPVMNEDDGILLAESANAAEVAPAFITAVSGHRHSYHESTSPTK
ncbi:catalase [Halospina denitrificans]|uniref:catalase n=1 Tax=Halospina denitrificans TaxID=332522 RepID=A0A4R7JV83_9GAMM|nr:catalase [Halospina denitrificans]TDT41774.1 catalase [Halospina denitrificans]